MPYAGRCASEKMGLDEIKLSIGIGDLRFGMTKNSVIDYLGIECDEEIDEYDDIQINYNQSIVFVNGQITKHPNGHMGWRNHLLWRIATTIRPLKSTFGVDYEQV